MANLVNLKKGVAVGSDLASIAGSDITRVVEAASTNGAIAIPDRGEKQVFITKGTAANLTLAAPTATTHDGVVIDIVSTTAAAHTITATTIGFNAGDAAGDVCTFGAAIGNQLRVVAYQGEWYVLNNIGGTLA
jgi:hypothetical protein